jgi:hypothetical protein
MSEGQLFPIASRGGENEAAHLALLIFFISILDLSCFPSCPSCLRVAARDLRSA